MSNKDPKKYLRHIFDECIYLSTISKGLGWEKFIEDETLKRAVVRSLEIIGEATKKIPADAKIKMDSIEWKSMAGMRDRLIHDYIGINYLIGWDVIRNKIPDLKNQISIELEKTET